jgi:hypothetical protein
LDTSQRQEMKLAAILIALMGLAAASYIKPTGDVKYFDKDMISKQKFFLDVCHKVWEGFYFEEYKSLDQEYFVFDKTFYVKYDHDMEYFYDMFKSTGFAPRGVTYSSFDKHFLKEVSGLFKFFYYAKDFATVQQNILWARQYINENVFVYALQMFVYHHDDYQYIVLPALYEIFPFFFYNGKFIYSTKSFDLESFKFQELYEQQYIEHFKNAGPLTKYYSKHFDWYSKKFHYVEDKKILRDVHDMQGEEKWFKFFEGTKMFWVKADYSDKYEILNEEYGIDYLTEDFDWNMFWYNYFIQHPTFLDEKEFSFERRGESFLYTVQQILARYYSERYAQGLGEIEQFSWYTPAEFGYHPQLVNHGGYQYSYRPNYYEYKYDGEFNAMNLALTFEERIKNVIDHGFYVMADGTKFYFNKPEAIEMIGEMLLGSIDSIDRKFFGSWMTMYHTLLGFGEEYDLISEDKYFSYMPNVLLNFETMMRDPLFYQIYTRVYDIFYKFQYRMGHYKQEELEFVGVKMIDVTVDKFVTYFDLVDSDVSVLLNKNYFFKDGKFNWEYAAFGRRYRLNNKPFVITYNFESDKAEKIVFRTFLGPKYDQYGKPFPIDYARKFFYEIDQFYYEPVVGKNTYQRESVHYFGTHRDHITYFELHKTVHAAYEGKYDFPVDYNMNKVCGFPERLLLPRGSVDGLPMQLYVIATPFEKTVPEYTYEQHMTECGYEYDTLPYGYPFNRPINEVYFWQPNMYMTEVPIFHMDEFHFPEYTKKYFENYRYYY